MEQIIINRPEDIGRLIESKADYLREMTQKMIDSEVGIIELNLSLESLGEEHLKRANSDTENFKKKMWNKAVELSQKNNSDTLQEYKRLINFI